MKQQDAALYEASFHPMAIEDLDVRIKSLTDSLIKITTTNNDLNEDPRKALCKMKERQLQAALEAYGTVDMSSIDVDRIPMVFARLQAAENQIRQDLAGMIKLGASEKILKKKLEIAKKVLAEKVKPGGRA